MKLCTRNAYTLVISYLQSTYVAVNVLACNVRRVTADGHCDRPHVGCIQHEDSIVTSEDLQYIQCMQVKMDNTV